MVYKKSIYKRAARSKAKRVAYRPRAVGFSRQFSHEQKAVDVVLTNSPALSSTATFTLLNGVAAGASDFNRVGRRLNMRSIGLNVDILPTNANANKDDIARIALVYDRQPNGAVPVYTDIFGHTDNTGTLASNSHSPINPDNAFRFIVLMDETFYLPQTEAGGDFPSNSIPPVPGCKTVSLKKVINLKGLPTQYTLDTAVIAAMTCGALWLVTQSRLTPVATFSYTINGTTHLKYSDI